MEIIKINDGILGTRHYPEQIYSGYITATGTGGNNKLPTEWSVVELVEGQYEIVHNLGLVNNKDLRVNVTLVGNPSNANIIYVKNISLNSFVIEIKRSNQLRASDFFFIAILM